jgi:hopanoid biosynthesis associated RND transporter like protein HpnN
MRRSLERWIALVQDRAGLVLAVSLLVVGLLAVYTARTLSVDGDTGHMLSPELPWRKTEIRLHELFPQSSGEIVAVIDAATSESADDSQRRLVAYLRARPEVFGTVYAPDADPFFRRNGLLFLDLDALQKLAAQLNQAQPFLGALDADPSLHGLFTLLQRALEHAPVGQDLGLAAALGQIASAADAAASGRVQPLSWQSLMGAGPPRPDATRRFVSLTPPQDYDRLLPASGAMDALRAAAGELGFDAAHGVRMRLTGEVPLAHEELLTAFTGAEVAMGAALVMVSILLFLALRSGRLVFSAVVTLVAGLVCTAAFAAFAVGHLNLISIAFGVLYVGLGIDYALFLCMQYRELLGQGVAPREALPRAAGDVGSFMLVCAATTSIGFLAFVPTSFLGIAELGLISGAGMFISLAMSLVLLPALIALLPPDAAKVKLAAVGGGWLGRVLDWPYSKARVIWIVTAILAAIALLLAPHARFAYDPLDLRDPQSESVSTFRDLLRDPEIPALTLSVLEKDAASARAQAGVLGALPVAKRAMSLSDFVPADQEPKLALIEDLALTMSLQPVKAAPVTAESRAADARALQALVDVLHAHADAAPALLAALEKVSAAGEPALARLRDALLGALPATIDSLVTALEAGPVTEADLPPDLVARWRSADGLYRVEVWPKEILDNPPSMERFIDGVRAVAPEAVGPPVGFLESGRTVVHAFRQAFVLSFIAIMVVLLVLLRNIVDTAMVLVPLALAGLFTLAGMVALDVPFNFANVIALPLILGVGVDYGVYLVQRGRDPAMKGANILHTGTARAVLFGALITMANFGNLMLARHPGMVSMGVLLTVGLGMTLVCALVLLPSLLARRYG